MAFALVKSFSFFLMLLNFCMYVIVASIAGWALNKAIDHDYPTGTGGMPLGFPIGNEATGFMVIFALLAGVVGAGSCLSGLHHLRVWTAESLASSASAAMTAWAITLIAMGLACKEIHIHGRPKKLITLESFLIILSGTQLLYIMLIHAGFFGGKYYNYRDSDITTTTAEPQKGSGAASSAV